MTICQLETKNKLIKINYIDYVNKIHYFTKREIMETRILVRIINKSMNNGFKLTPLEFYFIKNHTLDLIKILFLIMFKITPVPYMLIVIILKRFKMDLMPSNKNLKIPDEFKY